MFAIEDGEWPGLSKLVEEAGEVIQVCGKLMGTGGRTEHWDGTDLKERLEEELADLEAAIAFVIANNGLDKSAIATRVHEKLETFIRWHTRQLDPEDYSNPDLLHIERPDQDEEALKAYSHYRMYCGGITVVGPSADILEGGDFFVSESGAEKATCPECRKRASTS